MKKLVLSLLIFAPTVTDAQIVAGKLGCLTVWNRTGQTVNDFHIELYGNLAPLAVSGVLQGQYSGTVSQLHNPRGVSIDYVGSSTNPGESSFFGVFTQVPLSQLEGARAYWTLDGTQVGDRVPIPNVAWWVPQSTGGSGGGTGTIEAPPVGGFAQATFVQRHVVTTNEDLDFGDLTVDSPLWDNAVAVDPMPQFLAAGDSLFYDFEYGANENLAVMYEVTDISGSPLMTFTNAAIMIPEPSGQLLGMGLLAIALRFCRRRPS